MYHTKIVYIFSRLSLKSEEDISNSYLGIILNSNWNKKNIKYTSPTIIQKFFYNLFKFLL